MNLRSFWRIIFDPSNPEIPDPGSQLKPMLHLEIVIWDMDTFTRYGRSITPIDFVIEPAPGDVDIADGVAHFDGGWIRGTFDRGTLETDLMDGIKQFLDQELGVTSELSENVEDWNISIVAEVNLPEEPGDRDCPIFYMEQPRTFRSRLDERAGGRHAVGLVEIITSGNKRRVEWSISGDRHAPGMHFVLQNVSLIGELPPQFHRIRVLQDYDTASNIYVYEILADMMELGADPASPSQHLFYTDQRDFYIGAMPDGMGSFTGLLGDISYLEFDPNSSCPSCAHNLG